LPNFIKIDPYNFELYRFKVGAFFETQCSSALCWNWRPPIHWSHTLCRTKHNTVICCHSGDVPDDPNRPWTHSTTLY